MTPEAPRNGGHGSSSLHIRVGRYGIEATGAQVVVFISVAIAAAVIVWSNLQVAQRVNLENISSLTRVMVESGNQRAIEHQAIQQALSDSAKSFGELKCVLALVETMDRLDAVRSGDPCTYVMALPRTRPGERR